MELTSLVLFTICSCRRRKVFVSCYNLPLRNRYHFDAIRERKALEITLMELCLRICILSVYWKLIGCKKKIWLKVFCLNVNNTKIRVINRASHKKTHLQSLEFKYAKAWQLDKTFDTHPNICEYALPQQSSETDTSSKEIPHFTVVITYKVIKQFWSGISRILVKG